MVNDLALRQIGRFGELAVHAARAVSAKDRKCHAVDHSLVVCCFESRRSTCLQAAPLDGPGIRGRFFSRYVPCVGAGASLL